MARSRGTWVVPLFVVCLLVCALAAPATAGGDGSVTSEDQSTQQLLAAPAPAVVETLATQEFDADRTEFQITVYGNGSAEWQFRYEQRLETDQQRSDFETFAEEFNTNETDLYRNFQSRAESLTDAGTNATDREMSAEGFRRDARTEQLGPAGDEFGVVEMSFTWVGFAPVEGDTVVVGDAFEGGLYIGPNQTVVFQRGDGMAFQSVRPDDGIQSGETLAESDSVTWEGERTFTDNRPRLELVPESAATTQTEVTTDPAADSDPGWLLPMGILVFVVFLGAVGAVAYRSRAFSDDNPGAAATADDGDDGGGAGQAAGAAAAGAAAGESADTDDESGTAVTEEELIPDDERVVSLLEDNGGRMKQVNIVEETGWSKSKVSMLLSDMEEEGTISKLRVGRENIVSLAGHEPDAAGSPFEDDED
ncbi:MAG: helix-turn-helix transcriptional regulator [Natronomonas sp.]